MTHGARLRARGRTFGLLGMLACAPLLAATPATFERGQELYFNGDGLRAGEAWQDCARAGDARCQYGLGVLFDDGAPDWPTDTGLALQWLRRAAQQGLVEAHIRLGFLYAVGREDLAQDIVESYIWFSLAAGRGSTAARTHRDRVKELMTEAEIEAADRALTDRGFRYQFRDAPRPDAQHPGARRP